MRVSAARSFQHLAISQASRFRDGSYGDMALQMIDEGFLFPLHIDTHWSQYDPQAAINQYYTATHSSPPASSSKYTLVTSLSSALRLSASAIHGATTSRCSSSAAAPISVARSVGRGTNHRVSVGLGDPEEEQVGEEEVRGLDGPAHHASPSPSHILRIWPHMSSWRVHRLLIVVTMRATAFA